METKSKCGSFQFQQVELSPFDRAHAIKVLEYAKQANASAKYMIQVDSKTWKMVGKKKYNKFLKERAVNHNDVSVT